ncbi:MAG: TolC family protein, partial [Planctomycetota bacterium]
MRQTDQKRTAPTPRDFARCLRLRYGLRVRFPVQSMARICFVAASVFMMAGNSTAQTKSKPVNRYSGSTRTKADPSTGAHRNPKSLPPPRAKLIRELQTPPTKTAPSPKPTDLKPPTSNTRQVRPMNLESPPLRRLPTRLVGFSKPVESQIPQQTTASASSHSAESVPESSPTEMNSPPVHAQPSSSSIHLPFPTNDEVPLLLPQTEHTKPTGPIHPRNWSPPAPAIQQPTSPAFAETPAAVAPPIRNSVSDSLNASGNALNWKYWVQDPLLGTDQFIDVTPEMLYRLALANSYRIADFRYEPWIQGTEIALANSAFDPLLYSDSFFDSTSEPVGNQLTTGTADRLEEDNWRFDGGIRKATRRGGNISMSQRLGHNTSNSDFFDPANQGTSRMTARWTQPLMRNRLMDVNRSLVLTSRFDTEAAQANFNQELQEVLREIAVNYWQLYRERAATVLRRENLTQIREILRVLGDRRQLDVSQSQYTLAESTVRSLEAELTNAKADILNFQSQLASIVNAPELLSTGDLELLPLASADLLPVDFDEQNQIAMAYSLRPELTSLEYQKQTANTLYQLACEQRKPKLDLILEGYMAALR